MRTFFARLYGVRTELMIAAHAVFAAGAAFGGWSPSAAQWAALEGAWAAVLVVLVGWYRR